MNILNITDGTTTVNLLGITGGYDVAGWRQAISQYKGGGSWSQSALSDLQVIIDAHFDVVQERQPITVKGGTQNGTIRLMADLYALLLKASHYWIHDWQNEPVWLERKMECETNTSYALLFKGSIPDLPDLFTQPFQNGDAIHDLEMDLFRGHWQSDLPGSPACVEVSGEMVTGWIEEEIYVPTAGTDDAWVNRALSTISAGAADLIFGDNVGNGFDSGIRFRDLLIPPGSTIISAYIKFTCNVAAAGALCNAIIYGEKDAAPAAFSTYADFVGRPRTGESTAWNAIPAWILGNTYDTPDIADEIQEIIDLSAWANGNDLVVFVQNNSSTVNAWRLPAAFEAARTEPQLYIEYMEPRGRAATCAEEEVFVVNHHGTVQLTDIYIYTWNGGAPFWGGNLLLTALPYSLLPAVPAVTDAVYFGININFPLAGAKPFDNIIFDLSQGGDYANGIWEYYDAFAAGWSACDDVDWTVHLTALGVTALSFEPHYAVGVDNWATRLLTLEGGVGAPAVTGYFIRFRVQAVGTQPPIQQHRHPYAVTWPYIETAATAVDGDIDALARLVVYNQSGAPATGDFETHSRIIGGLRSTSRGLNFSAYLNACLTQNPTGLTTSAVAGTVAETTFVRAGAGRSLRWNPAGVVTPAALLYSYAFSESLAAEYYGRYHVFLRLQQDPNAATQDFTFHIVLTHSLRAIELWRSEEVLTQALPATDETQVLDMGVMDFMPDVLLPTELLSGVLIDVYGACSDATPDDVWFLDLILIPVDERAFDAFPDRPGDMLVVNDWDIYSCKGTHYTRANIDGGVIYPKRHVRSYVQDNNDYVTARWQVVAPGPPVFHPNARQRWWFFSTTYYGYGGTPPNWEFPHPHLLAGTWANAQRQYLLPRGDR